LEVGKSIAELEALCEARRIHVFRQNAERLRAEACYSVAGNDGPRWLLLPSADHGVLPGSRRMPYDEQVQYMQQNYPDYEVSAARELVTVAILKYLQDETGLFPLTPWTFGRYKEQYQKAGSFRNGYHICLGESNKGVAGSVFSLVVDNNYGDNLGNGLFSVRRQI